MAVHFPAYTVDELRSIVERTLPQPSSAQEKRTRHEFLGQVVGTLKQGCTFNLCDLRLLEKPLWVRPVLAHARPKRAPSSQTRGRAVCICVSYPRAPLQAQFHKLGAELSAQQKWHQLVCTRTPPPPHAPPQYQWRCHPLACRLSRALSPSS